MNNFREVNDDMLKDWLEFRDQTVLAYTTKEDKKHTIEFDEICEKILIGGDFDMNNFREVNDDMLKDWLEFRDQTVLAYTTKEDKKHTIEFDEICEKILNSVPKQNRNFIQKQFNQLDDNLMDYISYWNEKYYRNGFCDGVQLIVKCFDE